MSHSKLGCGFCDELHIPYDVHFLKADGIWNMHMEWLKRQVVESVYNIKFRKPICALKQMLQKIYFFKIYFHSHVPRHRFKKINFKFFRQPTISTLL